MTVLIGITSKNRMELLSKAIGSALNQEYNDKRIMVFDDASTDGTQELVKKYPNIKWQLSETTKGYVFARNLFLQMGTDYCASLDDDSWFLNSRSLDIAVAYFDRHRDVAAIAFDIVTPSDPKPLEVEILPSETNVFIGCGHILRVDAVNAVGGYATNPGYYGGEEKDLCIRLIDAGYRIIRFKGLYVWHEKTSKERDVEKQHRSGVCNDLVFMWRRTPLLLLLPAMIFKISGHLVFAIRYQKMQLLKPCIRGMGDFFLFMFTLKVHRKSVSLKAFRKYLAFN